MLDIVDDTTVIDLRPDMIFSQYVSGDVEAYQIERIIGNKNGSEQFGKLEEELKELLAEVQNVITQDELWSATKFDKADALYKFCHEAADVMIVLNTIFNSNQFRYLLPLLNAVYNYKLERQAFRMTVNEPFIGKDKKKRE